MNRQKRAARRVALAAAVALLVAACGGSNDAAPSGGSTTPAPAPAPAPAEEPFIIGYAPSELAEEDFFGQFQVGLIAGLDGLGIKYEIIARAPSNPKAHDEQFNIVQDLITLGVDAIIIAPTGYAEQIASFQAVNAAGIPLFLTNISRPADEPDIDVVQYSAYSHQVGGEVNAAYLSTAFPSGTPVAFLRGIPGAIDDQRSLPVIDAFTAAGFNIVTEEVGNFNRDEAFELIQRIMAAHPETKFVYAANSGMAGGAIAGLESMGLVPNEDVKVWGYGGTREELENIIAGRQFGTVFRDPVEMGQNMAVALGLLRDGRAGEIVADFNATMQLLTSCADIKAKVPAVAFGGEAKKAEVVTC
jgi:ribose transport system substrate-binding protein